MTNNRKEQLENLLRKNNVKQARIQLAEDLKKYYEIDITDKEFVEDSISDKVYKKVYDKISTNEINSFNFPYNEEELMYKIDYIFDYYKSYSKETVLFYPSAFGYSLKRSNKLYLDYPLALKLPLLECRKIFTKLMLGMHNDLIIVSEELNFGFVLSEDEYSYITIEYWGIGNDHPNQKSG